MSETCPTVRIQDGHGGFIIINESDFDPKAHKKYVEPEDEQGRTKRTVKHTEEAGK